MTTASKGGKSPQQMQAWMLALPEADRECILGFQIVQRTLIARGCRSLRFKVGDRVLANINPADWTKGIGAPGRCVVCCQWRVMCCQWWCAASGCGCMHALFARAAAVPLEAVGRSVTGGSVTRSVGPSFIAFVAFVGCWLCLQGRSSSCSTTRTTGQKSA